MKNILLAMATLGVLANGAFGQNNPPTVAASGTFSAQKNSPRTLSYAELKQISGAQDAETAEPTIFITSLVSGTMTKKGAPVVVGDTSVIPGEFVVWTPTQDVYNATVSAFKVRAFDGAAHSLSAATISAAITGNTPPTISVMDAFTSDEFLNAWMNTPYQIGYSQLFDRCDIVDYDDDPLSFVVGSIVSGSVKVNGQAAVAGETEILPGAQVEWTPALNQKGSAITAFTLFASDGKERSGTAVPVRIEVLDATPVFKKGADVFVKRDELDTVIFDWATNIGPDNRALQFDVTTDNPSLFAYEPEISADGTLSFATDGIQYGSANVTAVLVDDAGRKSIPQTFRITVGFVNYPPSFVLSKPTTEAEYLTGLNTVPGFVESVDPGAPNERDIVKFELLPEDATLFASKPTISSAGTLSYRLAPTATKAARVRVVAFDGKARSEAQWFVINIPASPFAATKGQYTGLFHEADKVTHARSGFLTLTLTDRGACSGKLSFPGQNVSFSGSARIDGNMQITARKKDGTALALNLQLDGTSMNGTIAAADWAASVAAEKAASASAGTFTFVVKNTTDALKGYGAFSFKVGTNGQVICSGTLPDGTKISQTTWLNSKSQWPLFGSLYGGAGSIIGWISATPQLTGGTLAWSKQTANGTTPFTCETTAIGSPYIPSLNPFNVSGSRLVQIESGSLPESTLGVTVTGPVLAGSGLKVSLNGKTGLATGTLVHPVTKTVTKVYGAALQNRKDFRGFFVDTAGGEISGFQP